MNKLLLGVCVGVVLMAVAIVVGLRSWPTEMATAVNEPPRKSVESRVVDEAGDELDPVEQEERDALASAARTQALAEKVAVLERKLAQDAATVNSKARVGGPQTQENASGKEISAVLEISDADFAEFSAAFESLTEEEKEVEVRRAVVEWEDDQYPILAKLLMDEKQPQDILQLLYDDLVSRDWDKIRIPMLKRLAAADDHPFAADARETLEALAAMPASADIN